MTSLLAVLGVCLGLGMLARRSRVFPPQTGAVLNALVLYVGLPATVVREVHALELSWRLALASSVLWLQFVVAWGLFAGLGRALGWSRGTVGALTLTAGLSNSAFVGLPVIQALLGEAALPVSLVVDQLGSFLTLSSLGVVAAAAYAGQGTRPLEMIRRTVLFPPFLALVAAVLTRGWVFPAWLDGLLFRLSALMTPLALLGVGYQVKRLGQVAHARLLWLGLSYKLVLSPLMAFAALALLLPGAGLLSLVAVYQCAMPPMVTAAILATDHGLEPELAQAMVTFGLPAAALTLGALHALGT